MCNRKSMVYIALLSSIGYEKEKTARATFCVYVIKTGSKLTDFPDQKSVDRYICVVLVHYMHGYCP